MRTCQGFTYRQAELHCEAIPVSRIAEQYGTPTYIYSADRIRTNYRRLELGLRKVAPHIFFAVKANSNLSVLRILAQEGCSFDIVSGGELFRLCRAGVPGHNVIYSGVGKSADEIRLALERSIFCIVLESLEEIELVSRLAEERSTRVAVSLRINPDVEVPTHPYISTGLRRHKFGLDLDSLDQALELLRQSHSLELIGIGSHIGSQILAVDPFKEAFLKLEATAKQIRSRGYDIRHLDLGGGFGIPYQDGEGFDLASLADFLSEAKGEFKILIEPGRFIVGDAGILVTRVLFEKVNHDKHFYVVDGGMNDLIRPTLYGAFHRILPVKTSSCETTVADIVGPVCETADFFARDREIEKVRPGQLLAIMDAGAYGFVAASNYNSRPRPAEVLIDGDEIRLARARESFEDLVRGE